MKKKQFTNLNWSYDVYESEICHIIQNNDTILYIHGHYVYESGAKSRCVFREIFQQPIVNLYTAIGYTSVFILNSFENTRGSKELIISDAVRNEDGQ